MQKKSDWLKNWLLVKNPQFLSNQADIQATLPTHELIALTKYCKDWQEIGYFLVKLKLLDRLFFFHQSLLGLFCKISGLTEGLVSFSCTAILKRLLCIYRLSK